MIDVTAPARLIIGPHIQLATVCGVDRKQWVQVDGQIAYLPADYLLRDEDGQALAIHAALRSFKEWPWPTSGRLQ